MNQHAGEIASYRDKAAQADAAVIGYLIDGLAGFESSLDEVGRYDGPLLAVVGDEDILTPKRYSEETVKGGAARWARGHSKEQVTPRPSSARKRWRTWCGASSPEPDAMLERT